MNLITIPVYTLLTNDSTAHRTDQVIMTSSAFIQKMIDTYNVTTSDTDTYTYDGNPIKTSVFPQINQFFGDNLIPVNSIPYHAGFKSHCLNSIYDENWSLLKMICNTMGIDIHYFQVDDNAVVQNYGTEYNVNRSFGFNGSSIYNLQVGRLNFEPDDSDYMNHGTNFSGVGNVSSCSFAISAGIGQDWNGGIHGMIYPDGIFNNQGLAPAIIPPTEEDPIYALKYDIEFKYHPSLVGDEGINYIKVTMRLEDQINFHSRLYEVYKDFNGVGSGMQIQNEDPDNPMDDDGLSKPEGGDGGGAGGWVDNIDSPGIPSLPPINVCDLGMITMYNPSVAQVQALSSFLWSNAFDLNSYKKLFGDPMDGIIGLAIVPVAPSMAGSKNVKVGNIDSGVTMPFLSSNWKEVNCGWVSVDKYIGTFLDSSPYTKIQIYLPFIGIRPLSADDIVGGAIHVVYHVDVLTGACAAFIEHSTRGVLYTYNGSCITNVPLTAINFSGAIQNAVSAVVSGIGFVAGAATGAAPISAMGAMGLLNSAANTALNSKPDIQRSGNLGGSAGIMSILTPYVIMERPRLSMPSNMNNLIGNTSNMTYSLGVLRGFTMVEYIHIEGCSGTSEEVAEIESLLKQGVYL